jgi:hypothetical protein
MSTHALGIHSAVHPVQISVATSLDNRNRLTTLFRMILALPHLALVGAPMAAILTWDRSDQHGLTYGWSATGGALGAVALVAAIIAWFAIVFTGRYPAGLWDLAAYYLRWRVRVSAYVALLRDEYPPFGDGAYPVELDLPRPIAPPDRLTVAFRPILAIPHLLVIWLLGIAWGCATLAAWIFILATGRYPQTLHGFSVGVLRWTTRVEAYLLLLRDEYPPFSLT